MKTWNELTTPEQHLAATGFKINHYYITHFWEEEHSIWTHHEVYGRYDTLEEALEGLAEANQQLN